MLEEIFYGRAWFCIYAVIIDSITMVIIRVLLPDGRALSFCVFAGLIFSLVLGYFLSERRVRSEFGSCEKDRHSAG